MVLDFDIEPVLSHLYEAALDPALWPAAWAEATAAAGTVTGPSLASLAVVADSGRSAPLAMPGWGLHRLRPASAPGVQSNGLAHDSPVQLQAISSSPITTSSIAVRSRSATASASGAAVAQALGQAEPLDRPAPVKQPASDPERRARLAPHLRRAVQMRARLAVAEIVQAASTAALQATGTGVVLVTVGGRLVYADPTARSLAGIVGLQFESVRGGLVASSPEATANLHGLVHDAAAGGAGGDMLMRGADGSAVAVAVAAVQWLDPEADDLSAAPGHGVFQPLGQAPPQVMMTFRKLTQGPANMRRVAALFGLTRAEADVAVAVAAGQTVAAVAARRRVSAGTVQGQVRSAILKAGVPGVPELALLFARIG